MVLLIDNYDSFSYNLYQMVGELVTQKNDSKNGELTNIDNNAHDDKKGSNSDQLKVIRNDELTIDEIRALKPDKIIISPGPGRPEDAGIIIEAARELGKEIPILGVCLGHQAICAAFGGTITYARHLMHGKQSTVAFEGESPIFSGLGEKAEVARYHSLALDPDTLPDCLTVTARTEDGEIMAVQHKDYQIYGLQFHPESILTPEGKTMLQNFINLET